MCTLQARTRFRRAHALHERAYTSQACMHITGVHALHKGAPTSAPHKCAVSFRTHAYTTQVCMQSTSVYALHKRSCLHRCALTLRCVHTAHKCECASYACIHFILTTVHAHFTPQSCTLHKCASTAQQPAPTQHTCWAASNTETHICCATQQHGNTHSAAHSTHITHLLRSEQHANAHSDAAHSTHITHLLCSEPRANTEVHAQTHNLTTNQKRPAAPHPQIFAKKQGR